MLRPHDRGATAGPTEPQVSRTTGQQDLQPAGLQELVCRPAPRGIAEKCLSNREVGPKRPLKNSCIHISASLSRQPLVKGERSVRFEVNAVISLSDERITIHIEPDVFAIWIAHQHPAIRNYNLTMRLSLPLTTLLVGPKPSKNCKNDRKGQT